LTEGAIPANGTGKGEDVSVDGMGFSPFAAVDGADPLSSVSVDGKICCLRKLLTAPDAWARVSSGG